MLAALRRDFDVIAKDESVRVVVVAAEGKAFCAGHDLKEMRAKPSLDYYERLFAQCSEMMLSVQRLPVPVIARVQGIATAAGCQLVAMCDLAVASRTAKFAVSGVNLGLFCSAPGVALSRKRFAQSGVRDACDRRIYQRRGGEGARLDQPCRRAGTARCRDRETRWQHHFQTARCGGDGKRTFLPSN